MNGGQVRFNNYGSVTISRGASFSCSDFFNSPVVAQSGSFARRSLTQTTTTGAVTIMNGGGLAGRVTNSAFLQATGTINGDLINQGHIYIGNSTENNVGLYRQLNVTGLFDHTITTSTIIPQLFLIIGKPCDLSGARNPTTF